MLGGYTLLGRQVDVVETSRGCTFDCSFCSIIEMRGRNFHPYPIERVMADIADARRHGARAIFLVDDNITLDVRRFEALCQAIVDSGLQRRRLHRAGDDGAARRARRDAGAADAARGIPLRVPRHREHARRRSRVPEGARQEHASRTAGTIGNATIEAIDHLHRNGLFVVGGLIVGNPDDTRESIEANLAFARRYVDWPYIQHPTPYPRTPMTDDFRRRGLIVDEDVAHYDGTTAVVRPSTCRRDDIEFLRWRAERWMKLRHMPAAFLHSPGFVLRHGLEMLAHTFTGTTLRSVLGLESERAVFERFRERRRRERELATAVELSA